VIFDILVSISRYNQDWPSAVQVLFECNLANRGFWPYVFTDCNLCARGQETGGLWTERYAFVDEVAPNITRNQFFWGGFNTFIDVLLFVVCFQSDFYS